MGRASLVGCAVLLVSVCAKTALAQQPVADGPPSDTLANALRLYQRERYEQARPLFEAVSSGATRDAPVHRQRGEFFLAKTLFHLRKYPESLAVFERITRRGAAHVYFPITLQWLVQLHERVGPRAEPTVIDCAGRYDESALEAYDTPETQETLAVARYLLGRARFRQRRYREALRLLDRVGSATRVSAPAREWAARARATVGPM